MPLLGTARPPAGPDAVPGSVRGKHPGALRHDPAPRVTARHSQTTTQPFKETRTTMQPTALGDHADVLSAENALAIVGDLERLRSRRPDLGAEVTTVFRRPLNSLDAAIIHGRTTRSGRAATQIAALRAGVQDRKSEAL